MWQRNFSIIVNPESISARARQKNAGHDVCGELARRTAERIAYLWSRCSAEDRLFVLFRFAHTSVQRVLFRSPGIYLCVRRSRTDFLSNIGRVLYSLREIFHTCSARKSDFPQLCIKRASCSCETTRNSRRSIATSASDSRFRQISWMRRRENNPRGKHGKIRNTTRNARFKAN